MTFDESARIAIASAIILALAYVVSVTGPQASAFAVIITGLAILLIVYRRTPEETAPPTSAPDLNSSASYEAVLDAIKLGVSLVPAGFCLVAMGFLLRYRLTEQTLMDLRGAQRSVANA